MALHIVEGGRDTRSDAELERAVMVKLSGALADAVERLPASTGWRLPLMRAHKAVAEWIDERPPKEGA